MPIPPIPKDTGGKSTSSTRQNREGGPESEISTVITRLADIKLLFAECLIQNNKIGDALTQINDVRDRVGAELYLDLGDKAQAMNILKREREIELCGEQQRWFDLLRCTETVKSLTLSPS